MPSYDWGACRMIPDLRTLFMKRAMTVVRVRPPPEALLFYRSAAGLAQDLRLLKARGPFRAVLAEIAQRGLVE